MRDRDAPAWVLTPQQAGTFALLLDGAYAPLHGFPSPADIAAVRAGGQLTDGTPWRGEPVLTVPDATARVACDAGRLLLRDQDATTLAELSVTGAMPAGEPGTTLLGGSLTGRARPQPVAFADLHVPVSELRARLDGSPWVTVVQPMEVPDMAGVTRWDAHLRETGGHLVVQPVLPDAPAERWAALVRAHRRAAGHLAAGRAIVHLAPLPCDNGRDAATLRAVVAANLGARTLLDAGDIDPAVAASRQLDLRPAPSTRRGKRHPDVQAELDAAPPPGDHPGVVVFLTGLSGAGKSTIAGALRARLLETGERTVSLLDGDLVRRTLSRGLGFSRSDREVNVRRIGWVAAEVARHGGVAICAPIAPEDRVRRAVRADVTAAGGRFVLVHVDTPLDVCEARDTKGLYARARAGDLVGLTGVDAPYERPQDAEVVLDTAAVSLHDAVEVLHRTIGSRAAGHDVPPPGMDVRRGVHATRSARCGPTRT